MNCWAERRFCSVLWFRWKTIIIISHSLEHVAVRIMCFACNIINLLCVNRLFWKTVAETTFHQVAVATPAYTLDNLQPNSQYIIYIVANSKNGKSLPSETLIAWTDPAYPAFVEVCSITHFYPLKTIFWFRPKVNSLTMMFVIIIITIIISGRKVLDRCKLCFIVGTLGSENNNFVNTSSSELSCTSEIDGKRINSFLFDSKTLKDSFSFYTLFLRGFV